ncbi:MAG TPA: MBL fold metallo-hydrolase [Gammaproteobacteria bacterium]|nr:MBL fold metallo-hydrolase [Gammaproteobacteria bacterium]
MQLRFLGAARGVTGSCYELRVGDRTVLLDCGQFQGSRLDEELNRVPLPVGHVDAVILSHAHIDHSGRLPLLPKQGFKGPIYTHRATSDLCAIMLPDAAYLHEKDAEWQNKKRRRKGLARIEPLYTRDEARAVLAQFVGVEYDVPHEIVPGVEVTLRNAGHILGAAIVELSLREDGRAFRLVFSGDLGYSSAPLLAAPATVERADLVLMESTYGNRNHRAFGATLDELRSIIRGAADGGGNILIPAFAVGRTQDLLFLLQRHYRDFGLERWQVYLDSPMAIAATELYWRHADLQKARLFGADGASSPANVIAAQSTEDSRRINAIEKGAIVIAGSGMCSGGRILHHLKHNLWRPECHVIMVGFQAEGTLGRRLVDGVERVRLWGETIKVEAKIHTVGGLSAHADQAGLLEWYGGFANRPPVCLVHGEPGAQQALAAELRARRHADVSIPARGEVMSLVAGRSA